MTEIIFVYNFTYSEYFKPAFLEINYILENVCKPEYMLKIIINLSDKQKNRKPLDTP